MGRPQTEASGLLSAARRGPAGAYDEDGGSRGSVGEPASKQTEFAEASKRSSRVCAWEGVRPHACAESRSAKPGGGDQGIISPARSEIRTNCLRRQASAGPSSGNMAGCGPLLCAAVISAAVLHAAIGADSKSSATRDSRRVVSNWPAPVVKQPIAREC
eukprot:scaffold60550_cov63-Phaeocystis_antarctica.AAC.1